MIQTLRWENSSLILIDQTLLPTEYRELKCDTIEQVWDSIKRLVVRGAPAIGIAAAYGVVLGVGESQADDSPSLIEEVEKVCSYLATSRPTAVNLFWALDRMKRTAHNNADMDVAQLKPRLLEEAHSIFNEDRQICRAIGKNGAEILKNGQSVLTHCNAGALATADYGTALAVIFAATEQGKKLTVFVDETRPLLQGSRLTAWELMQEKIETTLICDNMAAQVMKEGKIDIVITGADRIAANGDTANKIGTYGVALHACAHNIPFYIAAPKSTFDMTLASGRQIPIEQRDSKEITEAFGKRTAPENIKVYNPAFDVTPNKLIVGFITEAGIVRPPYNENLKKLF